MKILIDTREQSPIKFESNGIKEEHTKLDYGDYACEFKDGYRPPIVFERKGLGDLFGTTGKGYRRFSREIKRAQTDGTLLVIIIEGTLTEVRKGYEYSKRDGEAVAKQLFTLMIRHHVPFVCCASRNEMKYYIKQTFLTIGQEHFNKKK